MLGFEPRTCTARCCCSRIPASNSRVDRKNLQTVRCGEQGGNGRATVVDVARHLWREGGVARFYRGIIPQLIRRGLDGGLLNFFYVTYKQMLERRLGVES